MLKDKTQQWQIRSPPQAVSVLFCMQIGCCQTARTFQIGRKDFLFHLNGGRGGFVIYCHLLSKDITHTKVVTMQKGSISYKGTPLDSNQSHRHLSNSYCHMCSTHWPCRRSSSGNDLDFYREGALVGTLEISWLSSASPDEWWNSMSACQSTATASHHFLI
jgi:hypothetical protein